MIDHIVTDQFLKEVTNFNKEFIDFLLENKDDKKAASWLRPYQPFLEFLSNKTEEEIEEISKIPLCLFQPTENTILLIKDGGVNKYHPNSFMKTVVTITNKYINMLNDCISTNKVISKMARNDIGIIPARTDTEIFNVLSTIFGKRISQEMNELLPIVVGCNEINFLQRFDSSIFKKNGIHSIKDEIFINILEKNTNA